MLHPYAGSIQQYTEEIADPSRYRPDHCPQCQAAQALIAHGFYRRTLVDAALTDRSVYAVICVAPADVPCLCYPSSRYRTYVSALR